MFFLFAITNEVVILSYKSIACIQKSRVILDVIIKYRFSTPECALGHVLIQFPMWLNR
jgi:hypothetical protein